MASGSSSNADSCLHKRVSSRELTGTTRFKRYSAYQRFSHFQLEAEHDTHDPDVAKLQLSFLRKRSKIVEILSAGDIVFALTLAGVCAAFRGKRRIALLNTTPGEVIRSIFFNKAGAARRKVAASVAPRWTRAAAAQGCSARCGSSVSAAQRQRLDGWRLLCCRLLVCSSLHPSVHTFPSVHAHPPHPCRAQANQSLITVSVYRADNFSSLKCRSCPIEYIRRAARHAASVGAGGCSRRCWRLQP